MQSIINTPETTPIRRLSKLLLCAALAVLGPAAQAQFTYSVSGGSATVTGYSGGGGAVVIPSTYQTYSVVAIGDGAFEGNTTITSVSMPSTVTYIGIDAFSSCTGLGSVSISSSVTNIDLYAFSTCTSLSAVTLPAALRSIGAAAFSECNLTTVTIPSGVTSIGTGAFNICYNLTNIGVGAGSLSFASSNGVLFNNSLTTLLVYPNGLSGTYTVPNTVSSIAEEAFYSCANLTNIAFGANLANIGTNAFQYCSGLSNTLVLPSGLININDEAFWGCTGLRGVFIPGTVTNVGESAFSYCYGLNTAYFQGNAPLVDGFAGNNVSSVFIGETGTAYYTSGTSGWNTTYGGWTTQALPYTYTASGGAATITGYTGAGGAVSIPPSVVGLPVTAIGASAFQDVALTSVVIPSSVTTLGNYSFAYNSGLASAIIPGSVAVIGNFAFDGCTSLSTLGISNGVNTIQTDAFKFCTHLTNVFLPASVASIYPGVFDGCSALTNIGVAAANAYYTNVGGCLFDKSMDTLVQCPGALTGNYTVPSTVTSIGDDAFAYCAGLTSVTLPSSLATIGIYSFYGCSGLSRMVIPGGVTSLQDYAFQNASGITNYLFYGNEPTLGNSVFSGANASATVYYFTGEAGWGSSYGGLPTVALSQPLVPPSLNVVLGGGGLQILWSNTGTYTLQQSTNLSPPNWMPYGGTITTANGTNSATITPTGSNLFFRLKH